MKTFVIFNPAASRGNAGRRWPKLRQKLEAIHGTFSSLFTQAPRHATQLTREALDQGAQKIIAVGGDGTVNEVINGWFEDDKPIDPKTIFSVLMCGSGCDFQRSLNIDSLTMPNVEIQSSDSIPVDVGKVYFQDDSNNECIRYYANIGSLGLSGEVDRFLMRHPNLKRLGGPALFLYATLVQLLNCPQFKLLLKLDDGPEFEIHSRLVAVANGQYFGGGMQIAPGASLDDGFFDVVWLEEMTLTTFLRHLPKVYRGKHTDIPGIYIKRAQKIEVQSRENVWIDLDGESPGKLNSVFEILPKSLNIQF